MARTMPPPACRAKGRRRACRAGAGASHSSSMQFACPACSATYEVPDKLVGAGRRLRCAKCGHVWLAGPPASAPAEAPPPSAPELPAAPPAPPATPALQRPPHLIDPPLPRLGDIPAPAPSGGPLLWAAWIGSLLLLGVGVAAAWVWRAEVVAAWPAAARLFAALGG